MFNKKYFIKIPSYVNIFFNKKCCFIIFQFFNKFRLLNLGSCFYLLIFKNKIFITFESLSFFSKKFRVKLVQDLKFMIFKVKYFLLVIAIRFYKKLKLIGVGYKIIVYKKGFSNIFLLKLGFSHNIFLKLNNLVTAFYFKLTTIFITGNVLETINQKSSLIKSFKVINNFTGKGIYFYNEKLIMKKNKQV